MNNILILEDEILIAKVIGKYLTDHNYAVFYAKSYDEAIYHLENSELDAAIIDINLNGEKNGIDFSKYMLNTKKIPFIILTVSSDLKMIHSVKPLNPNAYLVKPVRKESLYASLEMILNDDFIIINQGTERLKVKSKEIIYVKSDHIYLQVFTTSSNKPILIRSSLSNFEKTLNMTDFVRPHQSYIVNREFITKWDIKCISTKNHCIPISKSRRSTIKNILTY